MRTVARLSPDFLSAPHISRLPWGLGARQGMAGLPLAVLGRLGCPGRGGRRGRSKDAGPSERHRHPQAWKPGTQEGEGPALLLVPLPGLPSLGPPCPETTVFDHPLPSCETDKVFLPQFSSHFSPPLKQRTVLCFWRASLSC